MPRRRHLRYANEQSTHRSFLATRKQYDEYCLSIMQTITYAQKLNIYILYWYFQQSQCLNLKTILLHFRSSIDRPLNLPQYLRVIEKYRFYRFCRQKM